MFRRIFISISFVFGVLCLFLFLGYHTEFFMCCFISCMVCCLLGISDCVREARDLECPSVGDTVYCYTMLVGERRIVRATVSGLFDSRIEVYTKSLGTINYTLDDLGVSVFKSKKSAMRKIRGVR